MWGKLSHVWTPDLVPIVRNKLKEALNELDEGNSASASSRLFSLMELLREIDVATAEPLFVEFWERLSRIPCFVLVALYIGNSRLLALAVSAVNASSEKHELIQGINMIFQFTYLGHDHRVTAARLRVIDPYIGYLRAHDSDLLARCARRLRMADWAG